MACTVPLYQVSKGFRMWLVIQYYNQPLTFLIIPRTTTSLRIFVITVALPDAFFSRARQHCSLRRPQPSPHIVTAYRTHFAPKTQTEYEYTSPLSR